MTQTSLDARNVSRSHLRFLAAFGANAFSLPRSTHPRIPGLSRHIDLRPSWLPAELRSSREVVLTVPRRLTFPSLHCSPVLRSAQRVMGPPFASLADMQSNAAAASIHLRPSLLVHVAEPIQRLITRWADRRARKFRRELDLAYGPRLVAWRAWTGKETS
jgi:hypothetical protein